MKNKAAQRFMLGVLFTGFVFGITLYSVFSPYLTKNKKQARYHSASVSPSSAETIVDYNQLIIRLTENAEISPEVLAQLDSTVTSRKQMLRQLIAKDPKESYSVFFSQEQLSSMPKEIADDLEKPLTITAELFSNVPAIISLFYPDDVSKISIRHTDNQQFKVFLAYPLSPAFSGHIIQLDGMVVDDYLVIGKIHQQ